MNKIPNNLICAKVTAGIPGKNPYVFYYTHYVKMHLDFGKAVCSFIRLDEEELSKKKPEAWLYRNTISADNMMGHTFYHLFRQDTGHFINERFQVKIEETVFSELPKNVKKVFKGFEKYHTFSIEPLNFHFNILK